MAWEIAFLQWIQANVVCDWLTPIMEFCTNMGGGLIWIAITIILLIFPQTRKLGLITALALLINILLCNVFLKPLIARPRPFTLAEVELLIPAPGDFSFPSGHTSASFAAATAIFLGWRKAGIAALLFAGVVAFSRLYFFVHFPTDVLGGLVVGVLAAWLSTVIVNYCSKKMSKPTSGKA